MSMKPALVQKTVEVVEDDASKKSVEKKTEDNTEYGSTNSVINRIGVHRQLLAAPVRHCHVHHRFV